MPTASDLDAAGYPSILEWALDKERLEGGSSNNSNTAAAASSTVEGGSQGAAGGQPTPSSSSGPPALGSLPEIFRTRLSARFGAPKPRPLYAKLSLLLDLVLRRLHWDPAQPESAFSAEALLRMIKRIDKELGP
jgi:hypothetical protein